MVRSCTMAALLACGCSQPTLGGIEVALRFVSTSPSQCAMVYATGEDGTTVKPSGALGRTTDRDLKIGVAQSAELGSTITLEAHGYAAADCMGKWNDDSNVLTRS